MTEIAVPEQNGDVTTPEKPQTPQRRDLPVDLSDSYILRWAAEAHEAHKVAQALARTSFVPQSLRARDSNPEAAAATTAANVAAAILTGAEIGMRPMAALRSLDIIQGTPALRAHAMRGLVQSHGHSVQLVESDDSRCVMRGRRKGEQEWQSVEWTVERARQLGLTGKDQWKKQPKAMLVARATGEICRLIASDVLHGVPYAAEELDGSPDSGPSIPRVRVSEVAPEAAPQEEESGESQPQEPLGELPPDDPWYVAPAVSADEAEQGGAA